MFQHHLLFQHCKMKQQPMNCIRIETETGTKTEIETETEIEIFLIRLKSIQNIYICLLICLTLIQKNLVITALAKIFVSRAIGSPSLT